MGELLAWLLGGVDRSLLAEHAKSCLAIVMVLFVILAVLGLFETRDAPRRERDHI